MSIIRLEPKVEIVAESSTSESNPEKRSLFFYVKFIHTTRLSIISIHDHNNNNNQSMVRETHENRVESSLQPFDPDDKNSWASMRLSLRNLGFRTKRSQDPVLRELGKYINDQFKNHYYPRVRRDHNNPGRILNLSVFIKEVSLYCLSDYHRVPIVQPDQWAGPTTPADKSVVGSLKRVRVDELAIVKKDEVCSVCLEELAKEKVVTCLPCDHAFHGDCIIRWFKTSHYCPNCRFELPVDR